MRVRVLIFAALSTVASLTHASLAGDPHIIGEANGENIITVRVGVAESSRQALPIFPGISGKTAGATGLSMLRVVIPPGAKAQAHV